MQRTNALNRAGSLSGWAALVVVYVVWGSTYLAIRVGVRDLPPLTLAGLRYLIAGLLLYPFAIRSGGSTARRDDRPHRRQWLAASVVAVLLLVIGNGGLSIGEKTLGSGFAALLVATVPLWMVAFAWPIDHARPTGRAAAGLVLGLAGVGVLAGASGAGHLGAVIVVLGASASWGLGSVLAHRIPLPSRALLAAAMEMLIGGVVLLLAALVHGDFAHIAWSHVGATSWLALAYLIVPGSILAFTAYGFALSRLPLATVSTYAYVNPVVAVLLGALILSEQLSVRELFGTVLVVASIVVVLQHRRTGQDEPVLPVLAEPAEPAAPAEPAKVTVP